MDRLDAGIRLGHTPPAAAAADSSNAAVAAVAPWYVGAVASGWGADVWIGVV